MNEKAEEAEENNTQRVVDELPFIFFMAARA